MEVRESDQTPDTRDALANTPKRRRDLDYTVRLPSAALKLAAERGFPRWCPGARRKTGLSLSRTSIGIARFAEGRPGVLVVEATGVRDIPSGPLLRIGDDRFIPGLRKLVEVVREASEGQTLLFIQIIDFLAVKRRPEKAKYFQRFLQIDEHHRRALAEVTGNDAWLARERF